MKKIRFIVPIIILAIILGFTFACTTAEPQIVEEPEVDEEPVVEEPEVEEPEVEEPVVEEPEEAVVSEEELKDELFSKLKDFFEAVEENEEYAFFSSYTVDLVGTEQEYKEGTKTDIYFIIQEAHANWENIEAQEIEVDGNWATLTITGDRMAEGVQYTDEEVRFNFVYEENEWKIDFSGK